MSTLLALAAAVSFGAADYMGGALSRRDNMYSVALNGQAWGLIATVVLLPVFGLGLPGLAAFIWGGLSGLGLATGVLLMYRGMLVGRIGVVVVVTAVTGASLPVLFGLLLGERPGVLGLGGILLSLVAISMMAYAEDSPTLETHDDVGAVESPPVVLSEQQDQDEVGKRDSLVRAWRTSGVDQPNSNRRQDDLGIVNASDQTMAHLVTKLRLSGTLDGLLAGAGFAVLFVSLDLAGSASGIWPLVVSKLVAVGLLMLTLAHKADCVRLRIGKRASFVWLGLLGALAPLFYWQALELGLLVFVVAVSSFYPGVAVLLSRFLLDERLLAIQKMGLVLACGGLIMVSVAS